MSETKLWKYIREPLRSLRMDIERHEDLLIVGLPDCSFGYNGVNGWIELKYATHWKKLKGPNGFKGQMGIKVAWRPGQRQWLERRGRYGGHCFLLLRVDRECYLFKSTMLPPDDLPMTDRQAENWSVLNWDVGMDIWPDLIKELIK